MVRRITRAVLVVALLALPAGPAAAQTASDCSVVFNGVEVERIDSLNSPLELGTDDMLIFSGLDPQGTRAASVRLYIGPVAIESGSTTYGTAQEEFQATLSIDDVSPYGVGLFRAEASSDGCAAAAWVRVSGRFPLATLTGLTAVGLAIGGFTGQLGAIASRRRWARSAAAVGGIATGTGAALLGQQFGRLQLSYPSLLALIAASAFVGFVLASMFNPSHREHRRARRAARAEVRANPPQPARSRALEPVAVADTPQVEAPAGATHGATAQPAPVGSSAPAPAAVPEPAAASAPYWCYVLASTDVFDLTDHTHKVAELAPGTWYLAKRTVSGWAHVVATDGREGWVAEGAIHRHG